MSFSENIDEIVARNENGLLGAHSFWCRVRLSEVAEILNGYPFNSKQFSKASGVPLIRIRDIGGKDTDINFTGEVPEGYWIYSDDILVGMDGDFNTSLWAGCPALLNQRVCKLAVNEVLFSKKFLFYTLAGYLKAINDNTPSITVKHLSSRTVGDIPLPCPPFNEQKRIADKLDQILAIVERAKARLARVPEILKQFRQSVLAAATDGRLTEDWREHDEESVSGFALANALRSAHENAGGHKQGNAAPPTEGAHDLHLEEFPPGWAVVELRDVVAPSSPITYGILKPGPELSFGVPYVRVADYPGNRLNLSSIRNTSPEIDSEFSRSRLKTGDLLLSIRGTVGRIIEIPRQLEGANITQDSARLSVQASILNKYVYWALQSESAQRRMQNAIKGVAVRGINIGDVRALQIPLPGLDEQFEIVRRVETLFALADRIEARYKAVAEKVDKLTPALLAKAFRGELVPQDPNDEPATVLLERIRAARASQPAPGKRGRKAAKP